IKVSYIILKNGKELLIVILITFFFAGCKNSTMAEENIDNIKTREVVSQIIKEIELDGEEISYISEKANFFDDMPAFDYYTSLLKDLKIKDSSHLNKQIELYKDFAFDENFSFGKKIIPDTLRPNNKEELIEFEKYLKYNCTGTILTISKPIFNEDYNLVAVIYSYSIGGDGAI